MKNTVLFFIAMFLLTSIQFGYGQIVTEYFPQNNGREKLMNLTNDIKITKSMTLPSFDVSSMVKEDSSIDKQEKMRLPMFPPM